MPRLNLSVPFAEKDEAKRLGAKWDNDKKVWYVPDGKDTAPFQKWFPDISKIEKRPLPSAILFEPNAEGRLTARIDNLEVSFTPTGYQITIWVKRNLLACEFDVCPEGASYNCDEVCPHPEHCPYETVVDDPQYVGDTWFTDISEIGYDKIEIHIRKIFAENLPGIAYRQRWPEPAASEFATVQWKFVK